MKRLSIAVVNAIAPPGGGSRAERWAFLCRELAARGHRVSLVQARLPPGYGAPESAMASALERAGVERLVVDPGPLPGLRHPTERRGPRRALKQLCGSLAWPDCWSRFAVRAADLLRERASTLDVVITSGPPWSDHLVGYELRRSARVAWIADYGDPWGLTLSRDGWVPNVNLAVERAALRLASSVIVTTSGTKELFTAHHDLRERSIDVLPAGIEDDLLPARTGSEGLALLQAGNVYGPRASVRPLLQAIERYRTEATRPLHLTWFGHVSRTAERDAVADVADRFEGRVPTEQVREQEIESDAIVVLGNHGGVQVPAKLWRAAGTGRRILLVAADERDPLREFADLDGALLVDNRVEALSLALGQLSAGVEERDPERRAAQAKRHSWAARAAKLEEAIYEARASEAATSREYRPIGRMIRHHTLLGYHPLYRLDLRIKDAQLVS